MKVKIEGKLKLEAGKYLIRNVKHKTLIFIMGDEEILYELGFMKTQAFECLQPVDIYIAEGEGEVELINLTPQVVIKEYKSDTRCFIYKLIEENQAMKKEIETYKNGRI